MSFYLCCVGDITQKGYDKKRLKLITPYLASQKTSSKSLFSFSSMELQPVSCQVYELCFFAEQFVLFQ